MKLKDLGVGQRFKFCDKEENGHIISSSKVYQKTNDHGDITTYNSCLCLDDLYPEQKAGLMLITPRQHKRVNKNVDVIIVI